MTTADEIVDLLMPLSDEEIAQTLINVEFTLVCMRGPKVHVDCTLEDCRVYEAAKELEKELWKNEMDKR